jgi:hypothetical protein
MRGASRLGRIGVVALAAAHLAGCAELASAPLPDVARLPQKLLTKDEQTQAIAEMNQKKETHQSEALKQIEKAQ